MSHTNTLLQSLIASGYAEELAVQMVSDAVAEALQDKPASAGFTDDELLSVGVGLTNEEIQSRVTKLRAFRAESSAG